MADDNNNNKVVDIVGNPKPEGEQSEGLIGKKIFVDTVVVGEQMSIFVDWPTDGSFTDLQEVAAILQVAQHAVLNKIAEEIHLQQRGFPLSKPSWVKPRK